MKNYHAHTPRCNHAYGKEEEYIEAAIKAGYKELGFSDHTPWPNCPKNIASSRMKLSQLEDYVETVNRLKEKYKDQISIKLGLEVEYFPQHMEWVKQIIKQYKLDYIILGNHFHLDGVVNKYYGSPIGPEDLINYVNDAIAAFKTGLYAYLAHPDLPNIPTYHPQYKVQMRRLCESAKAYNIPLEFNMLGYTTNRQYPNDTFFNIACEVGNTVIIGVDAHEPASLLDVSNFKKALHELHEMGLKTIDTIPFFKHDS